MCGIIGMFNPGTHCLNADKILTESLFASQLRGRDSVGVFLQRSDGEKDWLKQIGPVDEFMQWTGQHDRFFQQADRAKFVVGHVRAATIGDKKDMNAAHPHVTKNIMLVHNGTLNKYPDQNKHVSDSAAVAALLETEPNFIEVDDEISGPYAFVWFDRRDSSLNFARNEGRPLDFVSLDSGEIFFASEGKMLDWILTRENKKIHKQWALEPRTWTKVFVNTTEVKETKVPFVSRKWQNSDIGERTLSFEEFQNLPECKRAFETINGTEKPLAWGDTRMTGGKAPKKQSVTHFTSPHERGDPLMQGREESPVLIADADGNIKVEKKDKPHGRVLENWSGLAIGAAVQFSPIRCAASGTKMDAVRLEGPMIIWNEDGTMSPLSGVEIKSNIYEKEDNKDIDIADRLGEITNRIGKGPVVYEAIVRSIFENQQTKRITIYCSTAEWYDWFSGPDFALTTDDVLKAWSSPFKFEAAPEVAAIEKK